MSYEVPTVDDVIARFPELSTIDSGVFDLVLLEAQRSVDTTWLEGDFKTAIMYLTAHLAAIADETSDGDASAQQIVSEHWGELSLNYTQIRSALNPSGLRTTKYGQLFADLLKRNFPPIFVV